jgi:hypothetical protein
MADQPPYSDPSGDSGVGSDDESTAGVPRWVKALSVFALLIVLLFVILHLAFGGFRGH